MKKNECRTLSRRTAKDKIAKLVELTNTGCHDAAIELHSTAAFAVELLTWCCKKNPELFIPIARKKFSWPVLYSPHPEMVRENAAFMRGMMLGKNTQINLSSGKTFSWQVPANVVVFNLYRLAKNLRRAPMSSWTSRDHFPLAWCGVGRTSSGGHCYDEKYRGQLKSLERWGQRGAGKQLPELSKETAGQWASATVELFRIAFGEDFENHPNLQELKRSVLLRARDAYGRQGGRGVVRKMMLQAVRQAWRSIAALD